VAETVAVAADRPQVGAGEATGPFEDDHHRHLFASRSGADGVERPRRFRVRWQEAALPGGGDVVDVGVGEEAAGADQEPDRDRHPAPAGAGDHAASLRLGSD
jgi:hypothetical protein